MLHNIKLKMSIYGKSRDKKRFVSHGFCHCARPSQAGPSAERVDSSSVLPADYPGQAGLSRRRHGQGCRRAVGTWPVHSSLGRT